MDDAAGPSIHPPRDSSDAGWQPDEFTGTDFPYKAPDAFKEIRESVNLRESPDTKAYFDQFYDQGGLGSCVANATSACYRFEVRRHIALDNIKDRQAISPSRLFVYYNARAAKYQVIGDTGCKSRYAFKSLNKIGVCEEETWPYYTGRYQQKGESDADFDKYLNANSTANSRPKDDAYNEAEAHQIKTYFRLDVDRDPTKKITWDNMEADGRKVLDNVRFCLNEGHPVVFGFGWTDGQSPWTFENDSWRLMPLTKPRHAPVENRSGHAVMAIGYSETEKAVLCQNSWGFGKDDKSLFWVPYEWITDFEATNDFWMMRLVGE
jgi:C1A family cysteine protease